MKATFEQWSTALAYTESNNNPNAPLGDDGRAIGRWQMHLPFLYTWLTLKDWWETDLTIDERERFALQIFYNRAKTLNIDDIDAACGFNKNGQPNGCKATDNPLYANHFQVWLSRIRNGSVATNSYD